MVSYTYDEYGRKESLRYPEGKKVFYEYDAMDRLIAVKGLDGTKTEYSYNSAGQRTQTADGKLTTDYGYDVVGNLTKQITTGRTEISFEYLYDLNNRMLAETRNESGSTVKSWYVYDKLGQIESFQNSQGYSETFAYDAAGDVAKYGDEIADAAKQADKLDEVIEGGAEGAKAKPYSNGRPSYGDGQIEDVWDSAKDPITGKVYDPTGVEIKWDTTTPRYGQWDMGHIPGEKYSDIHKLYMDGVINKEEFLDWYRNSENYRPELPSTNRGHYFE